MGAKFGVRQGKGVRPFSGSVTYCIYYDSRFAGGV